MKRVGQITGVTEGKLEVTFCRPADCAKCHACFGGKPTTTLLLAGEGKVGDHALVDVPDAVVVKASLLAYVVPMLGLIAGAAMGSVIAGNTGSAVGGVLGLGISLGGVLLGEKKRRAQRIW